MKLKRQYTSLTALYLIPLLYKSDTVCGKITWLGDEFYLRYHIFPFKCVFVCFSLCYFMFYYVTTHSVCHTQSLVSPANNISLSAINEILYSFITTYYNLYPVNKSEKQQ
jgi:fucose 4-O-acetylase-like acetyltransferase